MTRLERSNIVISKKPRKAKNKRKITIKKRDEIDMTKYNNNRAIRLRYTLMGRLTRAEKQLYKILDQNRIVYIKQYPIEIDNKIYIVDAYLPLTNTILEVDGGIHNVERVAKRDKERDNILISNGYRIIHISNDDVLNSNFSFYVTNVIAC